MTMNVYKVNIPLKPQLSPTVFAFAAIEGDEVIALRYLVDILGKEYFDLTHGVEDFTDEVLNKLCFHDKSKKAFKKLSEVSSTGDICR